MKTPKTIPAPLPTDHRLLRLADMLKVSRRDALGATVEVWAWVDAQATEGIVPQPVVLLDGVAGLEGYGEAAVAVGLVGTADGNIVAPAELRPQRRSQPGAGERHDPGDDQRRRKSDRDRQRRHRTRKKLTEPVTPAAAPMAEQPAESKRTPRRLGEVEGFAVMLLYSRQGVPFYKLTGASPKEFTGTVSDPENPTLSDALRALLNSMKREATKGLGFSGKDFRPTMEQVVAVARQEKDFIEPPDIIGKKDAPSPAGSTSHDVGTVAPSEGGEPADTPTIRRPRGLRTLCARNALLMSARPAESGPVAEPGERDKSVTVTDVERDSVTVTEVSRPESVTSPANSSGDNDLRQRDTGVTVTDAAPSSSSISFSSSSFPEGKEEEKEEKKQETTTTRSVTPDTEPATSERKPVMPAGEQQALLIWRYAAGLRTTEDAVRYQWNNEPEALAARLVRAGIDPGTGRRLKYSAAETGDDAPRSPQDAPGAPQGTGTAVQTLTDVQASGGIVAAPAATTPAAGSPASSRARRRSGLSHVGDILPDGLRADVERDHERDAERDIGSRAPDSPPAGSADHGLPDAAPPDDSPPELLTDADLEQRRKEALQAVAAFSTTPRPDIKSTASPAAD